LLKRRKQEEWLVRHKIEKEKQEKADSDFIEKYRKIPLEDFKLLNKELQDYQKIKFISKIHKHTNSEAEELLKTAERAEKKARLSIAKRKIFRRLKNCMGLFPMKMKKTYF